MRYDAAGRGGAGRHGGHADLCLHPGSFAAEGSTLLSMPWGIESLVDLYVGFALFSNWIAYREPNPVKALAWIVLVMVLGFFAASRYMPLALRSSGGSWPRFWMGARAAA